MAQYTQLPSQSTAQLPLYSDSPSSTSSSRTPTPFSSSSPKQATRTEDEKALLSKDTTTDEEEELEREIRDPAPPSGTPSNWIDKLPLRPRTLFFSLLSISILVSLFLFFHPSKPFSLSTSSSSISHDSTSYYSGAPLSIGTFDDPSLAQLAPNPLEQDATFSDVPFAKVGESWDEKGRKPEWAGGDGGSREYEKGFKGEKGNRFWNGTGWYDKTVLMITIEGMRTDYLSQELTPNLYELANQGFKVDALKPVFPSLSSPNHWSILTGLYPSSHGIISNRFRLNKDSTTTKTFNSESSSQDSKIWDPEWYNGEPIYQTALRSNLKVATLMHPLIPPQLKSSSSARPTYWYPPIPRTHPRKKLSKIFTFFDQLYQKRPQLILTNFDELVHQAKKSGTSVIGGDGSEEEEEGGVGAGVEKSLRMIDESFFGGLKEGLKERGLENWVEIVVVGVTGFTDVEKDKVLFLDDIMDAETIERLRGEGQETLEGGASTVVGLRLDLESESESILDQLRAASNEGEGGFDVYTKDTMPSEWHFFDATTQNDRIAPVWLVAREGWTITTRAGSDEMGGKLGFKATNGYDPSLSSSMNTIFLSKGPHSKTVSLATTTTRRKDFSNLEVYDFVADSLAIPIEMRASNNGTLGFWEDAEEGRG